MNKWFFVWVFALTSCLAAADGVRYAPVLPEAEMVAPGAIEASTRQAARSAPPVQDLSRVIVPELKGLLLTDCKERLYAVSPEVSGVQVGENARFAFSQWDGLTATLQKHLGKPATIATLLEIEKEIQNSYQKHSISYVSVQFPQQDASNGTLQILLTEGKVHSVRVEGARWFDNDQLAKNLWVKEGNYFDQNDAREDVIWLNRNPFRETEIKIEPTGETPGDLDIIYQVKDHLPLRGTLGYTDTGTKTTGIERIFIGGTYGNLFHKSNILNYQLTSTPDFNTVVNHSLTWLVPISKTRNFLSVRGNFASIDCQSSEGINWGAGFDLNRRLWTKATEDYRRTATFSTGFEFLHADTDVDVGGGSQLFNIPVETAQIVFGFDWNHLSKEGYVDFNTKLHISPGGFSMYNDDEYFWNFSGSTTTRADYLYATFELDTLRHFELLDAHCRLFGQVSSTGLISYDQVGLGGSGSVRGYYQYTEDRDSAFLMNLELLTPTQETPASKFLDQSPVYRGLRKHYTDNLQLYTFLDVGVGCDWKAPNSKAKTATTTLAGSGLGIRYNYGPWINFDFAYGFQLLEPEDKSYSMLGRPHLTVVLCR